jgi:hypothetical protein
VHGGGRGDKLFFSSAVFGEKNFFFSARSRLKLFLPPPSP